MGRGLGSARPLRRPRVWSLLDPPESAVRSLSRPLFIQQWRARNIQIDFLRLNLKERWARKCWWVKKHFLDAGPEKMFNWLVFFLIVRLERQGLLDPLEYHGW